MIRNRGRPNPALSSGCSSSPCRKAAAFLRELIAIVRARLGCEQDLLDAIRGAIERDREARRERQELAELRRRYDTLTPRERDVMTRIVAGLLNKQVAAELGTNENTVKEQRG